MNANEALRKMKEGNPAVSYAKGKRSVFSVRNGKVAVLGENSSFVLTSQDFLEIYEKENFFEMEEEDSGIDPEKDREYYAYGGLKH